MESYIYIYIYYTRLPKQQLLVPNAAVFRNKPSHSILTTGEQSWVAKLTCRWTFLKLHKVNKNESTIHTILGDNELLPTFRVNRKKVFVLQIDL